MAHKVTLSDEQYELLKAFMAQSQAPAEPVVANPVHASAAQIARERIAVLGGKVSLVGKDGRKGCAFGSCDKRFLPNGNGDVDHTGCEAARPWFTAISAATKDGNANLAEALIAEARKLAAELNAA
jgi:hypothetical protein